MATQLKHGWSILTGDPEDPVHFHPLDCCSYAILSSVGIVMFDAGAGVDRENVLNALEALYPGIKVTALFLTHAHPDHTGGAEAVQERHGCTLLSGPKTAEWMLEGNKVAMCLEAAQSLGAYGDGYVTPRFRVNQVLSDGDVCQFGDVTVRAISTPGHSSDHFSYLVSQKGHMALVAGDAIFSNGTVLLQRTWDCSMADTLNSVEKLGQISFDTLLPGHGAPLLEDGTSSVMKAQDRIARLLPPLNMF